MADRAARGGGVGRPLSGPQSALVPYNPGGGGADWFGPSEPMAPMAPEEVRGRSWDFPANYNLNVTRRPYEPVSFLQMRALADALDLLRLVIETRKDQMAKEVPVILPVDPLLKPDDPSIAGEVAAAQALLREPYPGMDWDEWLRRILEDLFVIDAPCVYVRPTRGGDLYGLKPINGAEINRVLDPWGDTPEPPHAAYVHILKGVGAVHYTRDQLIYRPRNPRNGRAYGYSPVEQIITLINIALRRELWQLNFFTEGNMPDALIGVPMEWTPDQIRNFQDWFDARLNGQLGKRRGATFVPGDVAKGYVPTKETELFGKGEEWLARVICFAFSISPQPFVQMMNRATAGTAQESAEEEGLEPIKQWTSGFLQRAFTLRGWTRVKVGWQEKDDTDPKIVAEIQDILVKGGIRRRNEARAKLGDDPDPSPEADMLTVTTASGLIPVAFDEQMAQAEARQAIAPPEPAPGSSSAVGGSRGGGSGGPKPSQSGSRATGAGKAAGLPAPVRKALAPIKLDRPVVRRARAALKRSVRAALAATGDDVAAQVATALKAAGKARKVDEKDGDGQVHPLPLPVDVDALVDGLDLSSLDVLADAAVDPLSDVFSDAGQRAAAQIGAGSAEGLVDRVNEAGVDYARDRAAELVGKRWTADGELIDSPRPGIAITESTRDDLRTLIAKGLEDNIGTPAIADSIQAAFTFSPERADLIARTEVSFANAGGKMDGWREGSAAAGVTLKKIWQTTSNDNCCDDCAENEDAGPVDLEEDFPSGDEAEPAHPNCQCVTYVEIEESEGGSEADDEE